jgi:hypothetical protein
MPSSTLLDSWSTCNVDVEMNEAYAPKNLINLNVNLYLIQTMICLGDHPLWHRAAYKSMRGADGLHRAENFVLVNYKYYKI